MIYRLKFRVHGADGNGKFVYNVRDGVTLYFNEGFRPATGGPEFAHYCVFIRGGQTSVALLKTDALWNGQALERSPVELRPGHLLTANGTTVEILECPAYQDREITKFLDLEALTQQAGGAPASGFEGQGVAAATTPAPSPFATAPRPVAMPHAAFTATPRPAPLPRAPETRIDAIHPDEGTDEPDKVVVPLSLDPLLATRPAENSAPEPEPEETKPAPAPKKKFFGGTEDPMRARQATLKRAAMIAGGFAVVICAIWFNSGIFQFDLFEAPPEGQVVVVKPILRRGTTAAAPNAAAAQPARAPASATAPAGTITPLNAIQLTDATASQKKLTPTEFKELTQAIDEGNMPTIMHFVESDRVSPDFALDELGRSPFLRAASSGRVTVMQYLLTKKVSTTATDYNGNNALMWSVINGHEKTVKFLLSLGLDPTAKRDDGKDSFQLSREYRQTGVTKILHAQFRAANSPATHSKDDRKPASR